MIKLFAFIFLFVCAGFRCAYAEEAAGWGEQKMNTDTPLQGMRGTPANLPDISVIGVLNGYVNDDKTDTGRDRFEFEEIETAFQGYIYPEMRADVFLALHKHDTEYEAEICEAKVSFLRLIGGLAAETGKIHVNFGKLNKIHTHHRPMIDQPGAITNFFGAHGLVGQGANTSYLFPLPIFVQIEAGAWNVSSHHHNHAEGEVETAQITDINGNTINVAVYQQQECTEFSLADKVYTGRIKTSIAPGSESELEIGSSFARGKGAHYEEHLDKATVIGADFTFRSWPTAYHRWIFQNEWMYLTREVPAGKLYRHGLYSFLNYRFSKFWDLGGRFDYTEGAFPVNSIERAWSGIISYHMTETSAVRLQYKKRNVESKDIDEGWLQVTFGIGPHSHELE
ncbi:MAG: hypothetical protein ABII27_07450 [bacterium]